MTCHVRKLVLQEYWSGIGICFQSCVGAEVLVDKVPLGDPYLDVVVHS